MCASSLAAESNALCNALCAGAHFAEWVQQLFCKITNGFYDVYQRKVSLDNWEKGRELENLPLCVRGALIARETVTEDLRRNLCITDAKSLYDALSRNTLKGKEKQVALVTAEIKQVMAVTGLIPRWLPHNEMICDGLTKDLKGGNLKPLRKFMQQGTLRLSCELDEVAYRTKERQEGRRVPRVKGHGE